MNKGFLLDTCFIIWMSRKEQISLTALAALSDGKANGTAAMVSTASAWEMGMLVARGRIRETRGASQWYADFLREGDFLEVPVSSAIFIASSFLPQPVHSDPIDRILIATAREYDLTIITRDRAILAYGSAGHVKVLAC